MAQGGRTTGALRAERHTLTSVCRVDLVFRMSRAFLLARLPLYCSELELELIQTQMAQKPMLRAEVGMRVRCANKASAE